MVAAVIAAILPMRTCAFFAQVIFFAQKRVKTAISIIPSYDEWLGGGAGLGPARQMKGSLCEPVSVSFLSLFLKQIHNIHECLLNLV